MNSKFPLLILNKHKYSLFLHFDLANLLERVIIDGEFVFEIVDLDLVHAFFGFHFNNKSVEEFDHLLWALKRMIINILTLSPCEAL